MKKLSIAVLAFLVVAWLGLWASNIGVLVYSADSFAVMRDCRYLVGISVVKRLTPLAERCQVIRKVGN
jgi:predicted cation transporter